MNNFNFSNAFDGRRLTQMTRASVQSNGRLAFPPEAARQLDLSTDKALLICPMGEKDFAVTLTAKENPKGFEIKKTGPYFYILVRSLLLECGIDCKKVKVVFDIIELSEKYEGRPVFKFNRRTIEHGGKDDGEVQTKDADLHEDTQAEDGVAEERGLQEDAPADDGEDAR